MRRSLAALIIASLCFLSCATGGAKNSAPGWILSTPAPDATNTYFVGQAAAPGGDTAAGTDAAAANMVAGIMQYLGVKVSVDTSAEARASLDSYAADITQTVKTQSSGRLAGFQVKERYIYTDAKTGVQTVYVLAAYNTAELTKEKARLSALMREKEDAVAKPEAAARNFESAGRYYEAAQKYIEACVAASGSDIDNADVKMERNALAARGALSKLRFVKLGDNYKANLGQPFAAPVEFRLVSGEGDSAPGVAGAKLFLSYQRKQGSRTVSKTESVMTDSTGKVSYMPPAPDFVGKAKFSVRLDFQSALELLDNMPKKYDSYRDSLESEIQGKRLEIAYEVSSAAKSVPTAVTIVDFVGGAAAASNRAESGLIEALSKAGFKVSAAGLDRGLVAGMDDSAILAAAKTGGARRIVYGVARVGSVHKDDGGSWLADVTATIKAVELSTGAVLYSAEKSATGIGSDEASAAAAALREIGLNAVGRELITSLP